MTTLVDWVRANPHLAAMELEQQDKCANETERDWDICRAVDLYRAPRNGGDERTLANFLADAGLRITSNAPAVAPADRGAGQP